MSAKFIRRIVEVFIAIFVIGIAIRFIRSVAAFFGGEFGTISWPVQAGSIGDQTHLSGDALISFDDGLLIVPDQPVAHIFDLAIGAATLAMFIIALLALRQLLIRFAEGEFVVDANTAALRRIGVILLAVCGLSVVHALILQPLILSAVTMPDGMILHPSISWDVKGMQNIWLHYDVPLATFTLGGLALLFSEAFRAGTAYREDSESVI